VVELLKCRDPGVWVDLIGAVYHYGIRCPAVDLCVESGGFLGVSLSAYNSNNSPRCSA